MQPLNASIDAFLQYGKIERGYSPSTLETWRSLLRQFAHFAGEDLTEFNGFRLKAFLYYLSQERRLRPRSIKSAFAALRAFGDWLIEQGIARENPAKEVILPRLDAAVRKIVTDNDCAALLTACDRMSLAFGPRGILARAVVSTLVYAGLRRAELLALTVKDVSYNDRSILVRSGKGQKSRTVYPHPDCLHAIREWLRVRPKDTTHSYLFCHDRVRKLGEDGLRELMKEVNGLADRSGSDLIHPHDLRHSWATRMLRNGADLEVIRAGLGHSQLTTTAGYLHYSEESGRKAAECSGLHLQEQAAARQERRRVDLRRVG